MTYSIFLACLFRLYYIAPVRSKQTSLFKYFDDESSLKRYGRLEHGGLKSKNVRKNERPLSTKKPTHLVLKSIHAKGKLSFLGFKNRSFIERVIKEKAKKFGIKILDFANVGNHLHLKVMISSREGFQKFLKAITALIARFVTGARKGKPFGPFWEGLAYTRVLTSKLEELNLKGYIEANRIEALKSYQARAKYLKEFNAWVYSRYKKKVSVKTSQASRDPTRNNSTKSNPAKVLGLQDPLKMFSTG